MQAAYDLDQLRADLRVIEEVFPEIKTPAKIANADITAYYDRSFLGYTLFHSREGAVHMALSPGGGESPEDFLVQAKEVADMLRDLPAKSVIEVGCGRGFNLAYLAEAFPACDFAGFDLSKSHIKAAKKRLDPIPNATMGYGDFHGLPDVATGEADMVLAVETLCHAQDHVQVFREMHRILRPGGLLVVYDGVRDQVDRYGPEMAKAARFTETAMAVPRFADLATFTDQAEQAGFDVLESADRTNDVLPNARRLERIARRFFKRPYLPFTRVPLAPRKLAVNAVAGLLMPVTMETRAFSYRRFLLRKMA